MHQYNKSSRRSFVGKIAAGLLGTAIAGTASGKLFTGKIIEESLVRPNVTIGDFVNDKNLCL